VSLELHPITDASICPDCDTVHRRVSLRRGEIARCRCCGAVLARAHEFRVHQLLAITLAAAILFAIANLTPVLSVEFGGMRTETNVWSAAFSLEQGWIFWAALVLALTMFLAPLLEIVLLLWVLSFAIMGRRTPGSGILVHLLHRLRPWIMTEVFLLGALVVIVKLSAWVHVAAGEGLWALGGLTILLASLQRYGTHVWWRLAEPGTP
jgi:paraquat-inducible protein A